MSQRGFWEKFEFQLEAPLGLDFAEFLILAVGLYMVFSLSLTAFAAYCQRRENSKYRTGQLYYFAAIAEIAFWWYVIYQAFKIIVGL